jgi:small subunit ribosomal protein S29
LTALSFSSPRYQPSLDLYTGLAGALPSPYPLTPYDRVNDYHVSHAKGLEVVNVMEKLGLGEAQGIMSIWSKKGMVVHRKSIICITRLSKLTRCATFSDG